MKIKSITKIVSYSNKYDLTIKDNHNFYANGVLVHNCTMTFDRIHARSPDGRDHPSRHFVKSMWSKIKHEIPPKMKIVGENLYAKHSIYYEELPSIFLVFAVFDDSTCLSWSETEEWCQLLGFDHAPVLYKGPFEQSKIMQCYTGKSKCGGIQEGYVVRNAGSFRYSDFGNNVAKFVRANHVQTDQHWMMQKIVPNKVISVK